MTDRERQTNLGAKVRGGVHPSASRALARWKLAGVRQDWYPDYSPKWGCRRFGGNTDLHDRATRWGPPRTWWTHLRVPFFSGFEKASGPAANVMVLTNPRSAVELKSLSGAAIRAPSPRYHLLDVWRGIACLIVVVHHAGYALHWAEVKGSSFEAWLRWFVVYGVKRMSLGVPLFFVISGYCILASVEAIRRKGASPWTFLARRVRRIYPPYWVAVLWFLAVVVTLDACGLRRLHYGDRAVKLDSPGALDLPRWVGNLTLTETLRPHVWGPPRDVYTRVAWSLCYEEQFYFLCFLVLLLAPRRLSMVLACITLASMALRVGVWEFGQLGRIAGTFPLLWHQFAVGLVVYYRLNEARTRHTQRALDVGLGVLVLVGLVALERETVTAAAFGLVLIALRKWDDRVDRIVWLNPLRACGRRCYSIYLVHLPVCVVGNLALYGLGLTGFWARTLVVIPLVSAAGVGASWAFFRGVESYFLNPPVVHRDAATPASDPVRIPLAGEAMGLQA